MGNMVTAKFLAALGAMIGLGKGVLPLPGIEKRGGNRWAGKRGMGHRGHVIAGSFYGKALLRSYHRENNRQRTPAEPTSKTLFDTNHKTQYRVWSDGSYRRITATKGRRLIAV